MKAVAQGIAALTQAEIVAFMKSGLLSVAGFDLTLDDLVVSSVVCIVCMLYGCVYYMDVAFCTVS